MRHLCRNQDLWRSIERSCGSRQLFLDMQPIQDDCLGTYHQSSSQLVIKISTKIATLQLIEAGKLQLETPAASILPELANPVVLEPTGQPNFRPAKEEIRIKHLLNHTSGLFYAPEQQRVRSYDLPPGYTESYGRENPVGEFYDLLKVSLFVQVIHYKFSFLKRVITLACPSSMNLARAVSAPRLRHQSLSFFYPHVTQFHTATQRTHSDSSSRKFPVKLLKNTSKRLTNEYFS